MQNRVILRTVLQKKIHLIDYEYLASDQNKRVVAFGTWAGIVGSYNALIAYGLRIGGFRLQRAWQCKDLSELKKELNKVRLLNHKILITGGGRVAHGAMEIINAAGFREVDPREYIESNYTEAVYAQIDPDHYVKKMDGADFNLDHFFRFPAEYKSSFLPFANYTDMLIACHYWDPSSPVFFTAEEMKSPGFRIKIIADVSCDILR